MLVQWVRNLQPTNERERRDIFTAVGYLGKLVLKVVDIRVETITRSHFDSEKVVVIFLGLSMGGYWVRNASAISSKL